MIAGLEDLTAGEISIGGASSMMSPKNRDIMVLKLRPVPHMTVAEHVIRAEAAWYEKAEVKRRVGGAHPRYRQVAIAGPVPCRAVSASGRHRPRHRACQRCSVRRTAVNLDAKLRVQMRTEIKRIHRSDHDVYVIRSDRGVTLADPSW